MSMSNPYCRLDFIQTRSRMFALYEGERNGTTLYNAEVPFNLRGKAVRLEHMGSHLCDLCFDTLKRHSASKGDLCPFRITDERGIERGRISVRRSRALFGYLYYEMLFDGALFQIYEIGLGRDGIKLPVYTEGEQVALIEKAPVVRNNNDTYTITSLSESFERVAVIFNLYYDYVRHGHRGEVSVNAKKTYYSYCSSKELKGKYDPCWLASAQKAAEDCV